MKKTHCKNEHFFTKENTYIRPDTGARECKICKQLAYKKWKNNNLDIAKNYDTLWRKSNPEQRKAHKRKSYLRHRVKVIAKTKMWRENNLERSKKTTALWRADNPTKLVEYQSVRRARKFGQMGHVSPTIVRSLLEQQNWQCYYCSALLEDIGYHQEHKIPLSRGGFHEDSNLVLSCPPCNLKKGTKTDIEFEEFLRGAV